MKTYSGPGRMLALRIIEYGIITIGVVGKAKYGAMIGGLFGVSTGLEDSPAPLAGFVIVAAVAGVTLMME